MVALHPTLHLTVMVVGLHPTLHRMVVMEMAAIMVVGLHPTLRRMVVMELAVLVVGPHLMVGLVVGAIFLVVMIHLYPILGLRSPTQSVVVAVFLQLISLEFCFWELLCYCCETVVRSWFPRFCFLLVLLIVRFYFCTAELEMG